MTLFYSESGRPQKGLPLVLLHGFCETHAIWKQTEQALSPDLYTLAPDLPGFGNSPLPGEPLSLPLVADLLYHSLQERGIRECILLGHSLGGYVSLALLEKYPDMVAGIGLMNSTAYADSTEKKRSRDHVIRFVDKHGVEKFIDSFVPQLFQPDRRRELQPQIDELLAIARKTPQETLIAYTLAMQQRKGRLQALQHFRKAILIIAGEDDATVPLEDTKKQLLSLSNYELHILQNSGHMAMYEAPEESLAAIRNFVQYVESKKGAPE